MDVCSVATLKMKVSPMGKFYSAHSEKWWFIGIGHHICISDDKKYYWAHNDAYTFYPEEESK